MNIRDLTVWSQGWRVYGRFGMNWSDSIIRRSLNKYIRSTVHSLFDL